MMNTNNPLHCQTLALAGLFQAAQLVQDTARGRSRDAQATATSLGSIFMTSPPDTDAVYRGTDGLRTGLATLQRQLGKDSSARDLELTGYVITLLHLERKLSANRSMLEEIGRGIEALRGGHDYGPETNEETIKHLADLYSHTISTLTPRVMVQGEPGILNAAVSRDMIRALLLAGMRAAVLWRQCGGGRLKLIFRRKALVGHARTLLEHA